MKLSKLNNSADKLHAQTGSMLIMLGPLMGILTMGLIAILGTAVVQLKVMRSTAAKELAFQIAEAGVNYYQWHLAHFPTDYADGTGQACSTTCGPFVKDYKDTDNQTTIGQYSLTITPPPTGTTIVTIQATGWTTANPNVRRTITARYGVPSMAKYAFLTNSNAWIGSSESVNGEFHTNGGLRFDGTGNAPIKSSKSTYTCTSTFGCSPSQTKPGIWGSAPAGTQAFWQYPVPNVDFTSWTADFANIKTSAQSSGIYLPPSSAQGYSLTFNSNGTVSVYKVTSLRSHQTGTDVNGGIHPEDLDYNARTLQFTQNLPTNGLIYIEDRTWVEGTVNGRVLVASARLPYNPATAPSIIIPNNLVYQAKDGSSVLGLMAQKDVLISYYAPAVLEINAALMAQNGSCQRYYFSGNTKTSITVYGTVGSYGVWTWSWVNGSGSLTSGYASTNSVYDANLLYGPPPSFPLTTSGYQQISWKSD